MFQTNMKLTDTLQGLGRILAIAAAGCAAPDVLVKHARDDANRIIRAHYKGKDAGIVFRDTDGDGKDDHGYICPALVLSAPDCVREAHTTFLANEYCDLDALRERLLRKRMGAVDTLTGMYAHRPAGFVFRDADHDGIFDYVAICRREDFSRWKGAVPPDAHGCEYRAQQTYYGETPFGTVEELYHQIISSCSK